MKKNATLIVLFILILLITPKKLLEQVLMFIATVSVNFSYLFTYIGVPNQAMGLFSFIVFLLMLYLVIEFGLYIVKLSLKKLKKINK